MTWKVRAAALVLAVVFLVGVGWVGIPPSRRARAVLRLPGVVEVQEVRLGSKVGGRVSRVLTSEGSLVEPGDPLVAFEVPELEAQRAQWEAHLKSVEAELERARNGPRREEKAAAAAAVAAAEARWRRLKVGFREEEIRQARSDWSSAEADLRLAEEEFGRADRLSRRGSVTQAECDSARAAYDRARGRAAAAQAHLDLVTTGSRPEEIDEAAALLAQARANLDLLKAGTRPEDIKEIEGRVAETRGKLQEIEANLAEAVVRAPTRAVVDVVSVRAGDLVTPNQTVVRILRVDDLWIKVFVPETEMGEVRLNQAVEATIDAYPGHRFAGTIRFIAGQSEFTPRNIQSADERRHQVFAVKVRVADPQRVFKSGMAAEVLIPVEPPR
ncbi:MAG: efflux RND transporter periplasmic adaptor subunit [Planctomycetaceae bacterium]|nr:efflux RND transporter periplasmic adaptor subunit [Planctomycetaceae bacterium]